MCVFLRDSLDTNTNELDVTWFSEILMLLRKCVKWLTWMPESLGLCGRAGTVELTPLIIYVQKALDSFHYWIDQCISYPQKTCLHLRFNISIVKLIIFNRNEQIFSFIISLRPPFWFHSRSLCPPPPFMSSVVIAFTANIHSTTAFNISCYWRQRIRIAEICHSYEPFHPFSSAATMYLVMTSTEWMQKKNLYKISFISIVCLWHLESYKSNRQNRRSHNDTVVSLMATNFAGLSFTQWIRLLNKMAMYQWHCRSV